MASLAQVRVDISFAFVDALLIGVAVAAVKLTVATLAFGLLDAGLAKMRILVLPSLLGLATLLAVTAVAASLWLPS